MFSQSYKRYVLGSLTLVYTLNFVDRGLMGLLLQSIKADLRLSDTQLGFLTGIAFGLFYATLGLPIARWADRGNRVTITSLAIGLWGLTVMVCLFVTSFTQLVVARIAAAVGESGCMPPTYSLVGDYYPGPAERTRAMAIYWLANPMASLISFALGGWLNQRYGWRMTFFLMGIPALLVAVLIRTTITEPRTLHRRMTRSARTMPSMSAVLRTLWRQGASRHLGAAIILLFTLGLGLAPWYAAFLIRSHGMGTAELGLWLGLIAGVCATAGNLAGGYIASSWFADNERGQLRFSALMTALLVPCFVLFLLLPQTKAALLALGVLLMVFSAFLAPAFALMQRLVTDDTRATSISVIMLLANLVGMGLGPQLVGVLSDRLAPLLGTDSLRYSMLAMSSVALWAAYHFWLAGRAVQGDLTLIATAALKASETPIDARLEGLANSH